jgi:hypothetical protein
MWLWIDHHRSKLQGKTFWVMVLPVGCYQLNCQLEFVLLLPLLMQFDICVEFMPLYCI